MNSMVLWYDLKKQGATNESMAKNPVLRDLSGNGHDATCYNFAWGRMSGIDGYKLTRSGKYTITNVENKANILANFDDNNYTITLTVSNIPEQAVVLVRANVGFHLEITEDGTYTTEITDGVCTLAVDNFVGECNIEVIEYPQYPNALVSDGVDDYARVTDIGLNSMKTIFVNMYLASENREDFRFVFSSRGTGSESLNNVALVYKVDVTAYNHRNSGDTYIDGTLNTTLNAQDLLDVKHVATLTNENGNSHNTLDLFRDGINGSYWCNVALYSFIAFNRILSTEEIEWVKTNLIETEQ